MKTLRPKSGSRFNRQVLVGLLVVAIACSTSHGQQPAKSASSKADVFADSQVDAIAARIKADLKALHSAEATKSEPTAPEATSTTKPAPTPDKNSSGNSTKGASKPPAAPAKPITSQKVRAVEVNAQKCQTADEAVLLFKIFVADAGTTTDEKAQAQSRLDYWEQAATDQLVRIGTKWIPKAEADVLQKEVDAMVAEAIDMLNVDNFVGAKAKLEKASKIYPDHLEAVFLLAVGALIAQDFKGAEAKFQQCLGRAPQNVSVLNNVAVCEIHIKQFADAVKHWEKAASIDLEDKRVAQNLGQFISDANLKQLGNVDKRVVLSATDIYQKMIAKDAKNRSNTSRGYVMSRLLRSKPGDPVAEESRIVGNGTGFVIAEGFILTNRHVVEDADSLAIQDPAKSDGLPFTAKVVAKSKDFDLALIECRQLTAPAVPLNTVPVSRGTEVLALGYPIATIVGKGLKATRGIVTGLPSEETEKMMVLDVQVNPGNSGGPLCDRTGRAVGIVAAKTYTTAFVQSYGLAIPMNDALPFIKEHVKNLPPAKTDLKPLEWTDVDAQVSPSTVMILIQKKR